jgi:hypothetical protein
MSKITPTEIRRANGRMNKCHTLNTVTAIGDSIFMVRASTVHAGANDERALIFEYYDNKEEALNRFKAISFDYDLTTIRRTK